MVAKSGKTPRGPWRLAKALVQFEVEINSKYPNRRKDSDGSIGDAAHAARSSDHNAWIKDGAGWVVSAMDITHDPANGFDSYAFAEWLRAKRDPRIKYVISNRKIFARSVSPWKWRTYSGSNPHNHHIHISVEDDKAHYDDTVPWAIEDNLVSGPGVVQPPPPPATIRRGAKGELVRALQTKLKIPSDGLFGRGTELAVVNFQKAHGLPADGVVGPLTWKAIG